MDRRKMPDTPWHLGYAKKEKDDPRRHKTRCFYYKDGLCYQKYQCCYLLKCMGSSHCRYYSESDNVSNSSADNIRLADVSRIISSTENKNDLTKNDNTAKTLYFCGEKTIRIKDIQLSKSYRNWKPVKRELKQLQEYYSVHYKLDKPVIVQIKNNRYYLVDNYLQYYFSVSIRKTWIRARIDIVSK